MKHICRPGLPAYDDIMCDSCPMHAVLKCGETYYCKKHWTKHRAAQELPLLSKPKTVDAGTGEKVVTDDCN